MSDGQAVSGQWKSFHAGERFEGRGSRWFHVYMIPEKWPLTIMDRKTGRCTVLYGDGKTKRKLRTEAGLSGRRHPCGKSGGGKYHPCKAIRYRAEPAVSHSYIQSRMFSAITFINISYWKFAFLLQLSNQIIRTVSTSVINYKPLKILARLSF